MSDIEEMKRDLRRDVQQERESNLGAGIINRTEIYALEQCETVDDLLGWYDKAMFNSISEEQQSKADSMAERHL